MRRRNPLHTAADRAGLAADRAVGAAWGALLTIIRDGGGPAVIRHRAAAVLRHLPQAITAVTLDGLLRAFYVGHRHAQALVRRPVREAIVLDLLPAPAEADVLAWLRRFVRPETWQGIGPPSDRRMPDDLARQLASDISLGKTQQEAAKNLRPFLDGSRVRARRAARTFGLHVANRGAESAWADLGDLVIGFTVRATLDQATRPEHRARDGTRYYKNPGPGQLSTAEMPHPPIEPDGSIAFNCRCALEPILAD